MKRILFFLFVFLFFVGCSVHMAAKQPVKKDLAALEQASRDKIIAEFGKPEFSGKTEDGEEYDIFRFMQGYSAKSRAARGIGHGVADVFTLGLWEIFGTQIEGYASGTEMAIKVVYDGQRAKKIEILKK